jgi:hypothetical protein
MTNGRWAGKALTPQTTRRLPGALNTFFKFQARNPAAGRMSTCWGASNDFGPLKSREPSGLRAHFLARQCRGAQHAQYPVRFWATLREVTEESGVEFDDVLPAHDVFAKVAGAEQCAGFGRRRMWCAVLRLGE